MISDFPGPIAIRFSGAIAPKQLRAGWGWAVSRPASPNNIASALLFLLVCQGEWGNEYRIGVTIYVEEIGIIIGIQSPTLP